MEEPPTSIVGRAALFRAEMAALPDWSDTLVVSHWGFILAMTGRGVTNGEMAALRPERRRRPTSSSGSPERAASLRAARAAGRPGPTDRWKES